MGWLGLCQLMNKYNFFMRNHLFETNVLPDQDLWYFIMVYAYGGDWVPNMQEKSDKEKKMLSSVNFV